MSTPPASSPDLTLFDYVRPVLTRWWLVLLIVVVATVGTYVYYDRQQPVYSASTQLYTEADQSSSLILGNGPGYVDPRTIQNQATLISSGVFTARVAKRLGRPVSEVGGVTATAGAETDFITISTTRSTGKEAADVVNAYAQAYIEIRSENARKVLQEGLQKSQQQLDRLPVRRANETERATLAGNIRRIKLALELPGGETTQLSPAAAPTVPLSPRPRRNAGFAFVLSLLVGIAAAFGFERFDRRLKRIEDAEGMYGASVLAVIPHAKEPVLLLDGEVGISADFHEAFRQLRTNLQLAALERPLKRVLVTSAVPGEGKSTVARNLAIAFREFGNSVVLVDADLRRPSQGRLFATDVETGITSVLTGEVDLEDALLDIPVTARGLDALAQIEAASTLPGTRSALTGGGPRGVELLPAGTPPANPQAILSSRRTSEILDRLDARADVVIIDSPPVVTVSDALALASGVDAIVLVSRIGHSTRDGAMAARSSLARVPNANIAGVVVNDISGIAAGAYGYGYGPPTDNS